MELCRSGLPGRRVYKATTADDELPLVEVADELHRRPSLKITVPVAETANLFRRLAAAIPADENFHNGPSIQRQGSYEQEREDVLPTQIGATVWTFLPKVMYLSLKVYYF
jgi:hypothetical protein